MSANLMIETEVNIANNLPENCYTIMRQNTAEI